MLIFMRTSPTTIRLIILLFIALGFVSCKKEANVSTTQNTQPVLEQKESMQTSAESEISKEVSDAPLEGHELGEQVEEPAIIPYDIFHTDFHSSYLRDPLSFSSIPTQGITTGKTAVVASKVAKLYPPEAFEVDQWGTASIKEDLMNGTSVPLGTLIQITGERLQGDAYSGMFEFERNYNYFYPVTVNGKSGYIFGADLYMSTKEDESSNILQNQITAELYRTNGRFDKFYAIAGYKEVETQVKTSLQNNMLAIQQTAPQDYPNPDDMIYLYNNLKDNGYSIFITTDLASHSQHLIFDRMLQHTEEVIFTPRLLKITDDFIDALEKNTDAPEPHKQNAIMYFQVAQALLRAAPEKKESDDWDRQVEYKEKNLEEILQDYPQPVVDNVKLIMEASGDKDAIFGNAEDFSQYKPRGHYTKNGILKAYFRANMWYGRMHFVIAQSDFDSNTNELTRKMEPVALLIVDTVRKNPELYSEWTQLADPITDLIGLSDDLGFSDVLPLWTQQKVENFSDWSSDLKNLQDFMKLCHEKLRPPAIQGNSVWTGPSEGWRFLGQRFTWDSYIHDRITPPRLEGNLPGYEDTLALPSGLHISKVFGSVWADKTLEKTQYSKITGLKKRLYELQKEFASNDEVFWNQTYYNQVLNQIRTQAIFEQGSGFYFTQSPLWGLKVQLSALGTWAELRHDTILYVKQSYAERGGGGDIEPTFRTEPIPLPINYIEPNIPFWKASLASVKGLQDVYNRYNLLDSENKRALESLSEVYQKALDIAEKEAKDEAITEEENKWIATVSFLLGRLVLIYNSGDVITDYNQLKMACIADVFTNSEIELCLETAVGTPYRLYIPLNDGQGGKRISVGYGFSYYEFAQAQSNRLSDEEWKEVVYAKDANLSQYIPEWLDKNYILTPDVKSFEY